MINHADVVTAFEQEMRDAGIEPPTIIKADGRLHRFSTNGVRRDDAGWYVLYPDGVPAGRFGCWRTGVDRTWCGRDLATLTPTEREQHRVRVETAKKEAEAARAHEHARAAKRAVNIWKKATPAREDHPYLARKRVKPAFTLRELPAHTLKSLLGYALATKGEALVGRILIVPIAIGAKIVNVQMIDEYGRKAFLFRGAVSGGYWATDRLPEGDGSTVLLGEGVATVLSASEATGKVAAAALSAHNLPAAATALRKRLAKARLILLADLDARGVGLAKATEAARAVEGLVAVPDFGAERPGGAKDFNDLAAYRGREAVMAAIVSAKEFGKPSAVAPEAAEPEPAAEAGDPGPDLEAEPAPPREKADGGDRAPPFSVEALALEFAAKHAAELRYVAEWSRWFRWRGSRWAVDSILWAFHMARVVCRAAAALADNKAVKMRLTDGKTEAAVERLAKADPRLAAEISQWDAAPFLLNMEVRDGDG